MLGGEQLDVVKGSKLALERVTLTNQISARLYHCILLHQFMWLAVRTCHTFEH